MVLLPTGVSRLDPLLLVLVPPSLAGMAPLFLDEVVVVIVTDLDSAVLAFSGSGFVFFGALGLSRGAHADAGCNLQLSEERGSRQPYLVVVTGLVVTVDLQQQGWITR